MPELVLTNKEERVGNVKLKGSLGCNEHEKVEFIILRVMRRVQIKLATMDFRRADFAFFRDLLGRVSWNKSLEGKRGPRNLVNQTSAPPSSKRCIPTKRNSGKNARWLAWLNKELLDKIKHRKEAYRG